uniref:Ferric chelate reductase 1 like n=1 Tax=Pavo cristatus TaxID=9049 RepID=A0A8C9G1L8_PAVCR
AVPPQNSSNPTQTRRTAQPAAGGRDGPAAPAAQRAFGVPPRGAVPRPRPTFPPRAPADPGAVSPLRCAPSTPPPLCRRRSSPGRAGTRRARRCRLPTPPPPPPVTSFFPCIYLVMLYSHSTGYPFPTAPPVDPFAKIRVDDCGKTKGCFRYGKPGCNAETCDYFLSYRRIGADVEFELSADTDGWVAVGFSSDKKMVRFLKFFTLIRAVSIYKYEDIFMPSAAYQTFSSPFCLLLIVALTFYLLMGTP